MSRPNVLSRLRLGWDLERALHTPPTPRSRILVERQGRLYTLRQLAEEAGVTENTLRGRLYRGHNIEAAIRWKE